MFAVVTFITLAVSSLRETAAAAPAARPCAAHGSLDASRDDRQCYQVEGSRSTMLMQVNVRHQRLSDPENAEEATTPTSSGKNDNNNANNNNNNGNNNNNDNDNNNNDNSNAHDDSGNNNNAASNNEGTSNNDDASGEQSSNSNNGDETGKVKVKKGTALYRILKRAQENAKKSGQPFEYLLDVDYIHDANNPLDNNMKEPTHYVKPSDSTEAPTRPSRPSEPKPTPGDHPVDRKRPSQTRLEYVHPECVTRFEPRATTTVLTSLARPGTSCIFGTDERDEGSHCIMDITYGSYGWCYTNKARTEWGSCSEKCPLSGQAALLERRISAMDGLVAKLVKKIQKRTKDCDKDKQKTKSSLLTENRKGSGDSSKSSAVSETKLAALRRDGLISEEEFKDLRMELTNLKQD